MVSQSPYKVYTVLERTAWQQAVLLLHNDEKWDIMRVGFVYVEEKYEGTAYIRDCNNCDW